MIQENIKHFLKQGTLESPPGFRWIEGLSGRNAKMTQENYDNIDWKAFRAQFSALQGRIYLNTAGGGAMSGRAADAGRSYYTESEQRADTAWEDWLQRSERIRQQIGAFIGGTSESVAFLQNASLGLNVVAQSFPAPVDVLVLDREFPSCTLPWLRAGHRLHFMPTDRSGTITAQMLDNALSDEIRVFVLSSVQYANGFRADLEALGDICRAHGVRFVVDATQSICAFEIDVERSGIDALVFSGYKWATAGYGISVLWITHEFLDGPPPLVGWRSARNPYRLANDRLDIVDGGIAYELGHPLFPGIFTLGAAIEVFTEIGVPRISEKITELTGHLRSALEIAGFSILSNGEKGCVSGITLVDSSNPDDWTLSLRTENVWVTARQEALRISVHAYNTEEEIDTCVNLMESIRG